MIALFSSAYDVGLECANQGYFIFLYPTRNEDGERDVQVFWIDLPQSQLLSNLLHPTPSTRVFALLSVCERLPSLI